MSASFADLKKIPKEPAARMLALAGARLKTPPGLPASAGVEQVLAELDKAGAVIDMLRLLSVALPPRERTWWACLAARDVIGPEADPVPPPLAAAEAWVFKPSDETRDAVRAAIDAADPDDETTLCATAALYFDDMLGTGDLARLPAPPGASQTAAFAMNLKALEWLEGSLEDRACVLIERALDIARGGNGRIARTEEAAT
jgi:hypothetical protein